MNDLEPMIRCDHVSKVYPMGRRGLMELLRRQQAKKHRALKDVTLDIAPGEVIGLVGLNGSGKSTLTRIISGVSQPTTGAAKINGTVGMLTPRTGLNGTLTGRENIYYKCLLLGFSMQEIRQMMDSIIAFAELEEFIDRPLKTYSSGMASRLGFAICAHTNPDILIEDEALAVGDQSYMDKCIGWINEYKQQGHCVIFVSHSVSQMNGLCDRVLWLHKGECIGLGSTEEILPAYQAFAKEYSKIKNDPNAAFPSLKKYQDRIAKGKK